MLYDPRFSFLHIVSLILSCALLLAALVAPRAARAALVALFAWAALVNANGAVAEPDVYVAYADTTWLPAYRSFLLGWFAAHVSPVVLAIAAWQLVTAMALAASGRVARLALAAAVVFFVAIAPLGVGGGFPATLLLAFAGARLAFDPEVRRSLDAPLFRSLAEAIPRTRP